MSTLVSLVEQNCDNLFSGECIGINVNGGRLKRESKATVIYQYTYEFERKLYQDVQILIYAGTYYIKLLPIFKNIRTVLLLSTILYVKT